MKTFLFLSALAASLIIHESVAQEFQFPVPGQIYVPGKDIGFSKYLTKSLRNTQKVVLTFDDGPDVVKTPKLLDTLKKFNVKATFFVLTEAINAQTLPIIKRMINEGHNVASHHQNHGNSNTKDEVVFKRELKTSILSIANIMEEENSLNREVYYRFPYGNYGSSKLAYHHLNVMKDVSRELFNDNCINFAFWDIDTVDWLQSMSSQEITENIMSNIFGGTGYGFKDVGNGKYLKTTHKITKPLGGGVILMHDVHERSVNAVPDLLKKFAEKGVTVVPMQEVEEFAFDGKVCRLQI